MARIVLSGRMLDVLIILFLFILTAGVRLYDLNGAGGTFDETDYLRNAVNMVVAFERWDFSKERWKLNYEHPPIGKYMHALFFIPFAKTLSEQEKDAIIAGAWIWADPIGVSGEVYRPGRYASVLYAGLTAIIVYLFGLLFLSRKTGFIAALLLAVLPNFIPYHKVMSLDAPISFFFALGALVFALALKHDTWPWWIGLGIVSGLAIATKFNLGMLFIFYCIVFVIWRYNNADSALKFRQKTLAALKKIWHWKLFFVPVIALLVLYAVWPWLWPAPVDRMVKTMGVWGLSEDPELEAWDPVIEPWFGKMVPVKASYYPVYFLFTTPVLVLLLFGASFVYRWKNRSFWSTFVFIWFITPFLWTLQPQKADGMRYITMIYPPLMILAAQGLQQFFKTNRRLFYGTLITFVYLAALSAWIHPYYMDYYNILIGGPKNVQENNLLEFDFFGEGKKEAVEWLNLNAAPNSVVGAKWDPIDEFGGWRADIRAYNLINTNFTGDPHYWMINHRYRQMFEETDISKVDLSNYEIVHTLMAGNGELAWIYKAKGVS